MKLATLGAVLMLLQAPFGQPRQQPEDSKATIDGVVVRAGTGEPLPRAQVTLIRATAGMATAAAGAALAGGTPPAALPTVTTDDAGKFALKNVEPGSYRIAVARNGYARQEYGQRVFGGQGRVITLVAGQAIKAVAFHLIPAGIVSGVVRDPSGEPMSGLQVQLLRSAYTPSGQRTFQSAGGDRTNDRGEYRVYWVTPGRYYLAVNSAASARAFAILGGPGSPNEIVERSYPTAYHPGTIDISLASVIEVQPGVELNAIDVLVPQQELFHVRGRIVDPITGQHPRTASVSIVRRGPASPLGLSGSAPPYNPADGTFDLRDLAPGSYWVRATVTGSSADSVVPASAAGRTLVDLFSDSIFSERQAAQAAVDVFGSDVDGLVLTLSSGVSIRGRFSVESQALEAVADFERLQVTLRPATTGMQMNPTRHQPMSLEGAFTLENVLPGDYFVTVQPLPPEYYVKEARLEEIDGLDQPMVITGPVSGTLNVVLSRKAGQISGVVVDDRRQAVPGIQAVLVPVRRRGRIDLYRSAATDQSGRFSIRGIPPGDYKVFAWEAIESFGYFDEDFVRQFEQEGKSVRIVESSRESVEVKVIPAAFP